MIILAIIKYFFMYINISKFSGLGKKRNQLFKANQNPALS
jgi:hypothetical protein